MDKESFHVSIPVSENGRAVENSVDQRKKFAVSAGITVLFVSLGLITSSDPRWPYFAAAGITGLLSVHKLCSSSRK